MNQIHAAYFFFFEIENTLPSQSQNDPNIAVNNHPMITKGKRGIVKTETPFAGSITTNSIPATVTDALVDLVWYKATSAEFEALQQNKTWSLVAATTNMHVVGSKWIFIVNYKSDGTIYKHKDRLVAQGFTQTLGVDFFDTFNQL